MDTMSWSEFGWNIIANIIASAIAASLGAFLFLRSFLARLRLRRFLGLSKQNNILRIYFSNLNIPPYAASDSDGTPRSYSGTAIPENEFNAIPAFASYLNLLSPTVTNHFAKMLNTLIFPAVDFLFGSSPDNPKDILFSNLISIGGPGYNEVTKHYLNTGRPFLAFNSNNTEIVVTSGKHSRKRCIGPDDYGMLQKLYDAEHGTTVFIAAGVGINGTRGALDYLLYNWESIYRRFKTNPFGVCLRFRNAGQDRGGYKYPHEEIWLS